MDYRLKGDNGGWMSGKQMRKQREHLCKGSVAPEPDMRQELHMS